MKIQYKLDKITSKQLPTSRLLFKFGANKTTKGTFHLTHESSKRIMEEWNNYGNKLNFDFNHQQLAEIQTPESGVSAGTYDLEIRPDGLYAINIVWTERAQRMIISKEYLYTSPAFVTENQGGKEIIIELLNCALTNIPATNHMDQLMAASKYNKDKIMTIEKLAIEEEVPPVVDEEVVPPVEEELAVGPTMEEMQAMCDELTAKLEEKSALVAELEAKIAEMNEGMVEELKCKDEQISKLSATIEHTDKEKIVLAAITAGKIMPAQRELYMSLDSKKLTEEVGKLQKSVVLNKTHELTVAPEQTEVQKLTAYINKRVFGK